MPSINRTLRVPVLLLVVAVAAILTYRVTGQRAPNAAGGCTCVVSIDLPAVLEGLTQRAEAQLQLQAMRAETLQEDEQRKARLNELRAEVEDIPDTDAARREAASEALAREALDYQAWRLFASEQLDIEKSLMYRELDRNIKKALAELAELNGYDVVLMDDSDQPLGVNPDLKMSRENQVQQQMAGRRVLHVSSAADVTNELIERMNNAFERTNAAGG